MSTLFVTLPIAIIYEYMDPLIPEYPEKNVFPDPGPKVDPYPASGTP